LGRASDGLGCEGGGAGGRRRLGQERELCVDPAVFSVLADRFSLSGVRVEPKRGWARNELTEFRFDVTLTTALAGSEPVSVPRDWAEVGSVAALRELLLGERPDELVLTGVPNARLGRYLAAAELLRGECASATVGALRDRLSGFEAGVEPEALWALERELPYRVELFHTAEESVGTLTLVARAAGREPVRLSPARLPRRPLAHYANQPLQGLFGQQLLPALRAGLEAQLPRYMLPSVYLLLERLPTLPNGKLDRNALPAPDEQRPTLEHAYTPAQTPLQQRLTKLWSEVLAIEQIGIDDNFFTHLGGHSLLATQLISRIRETFTIDLPLRTLFDEGTVRAMARAIEELIVGEVERLTDAEARDLLREGA
jgi:acyl carrier protein